MDRGISMFLLKVISFVIVSFLGIVRKRVDVSLDKRLHLPMDTRNTVGVSCALPPLGDG